MRRIAVYYRVSTDRQDIEHQRRSIMEYLNCQISDVAEFMDEGISGKIDDRPGFKELCTAIATGEFGKVVLFEDSRITRNMITLQTFYAFCRKHDAHIDVVGKGVQAFDNAIDQLLVAVQGYTAQAERENISRRVKSGLKLAAEQGRVGHRFQKGHTKNVGRRKSYDPKITAKVVKLHKRGLGFKVIGEALGLPTSTVYRIFKRQA